MRGECVQLVLSFAGLYVVKEEDGEKEEKENCETEERKKSGILINFKHRASL